VSFVIWSHRETLERENHWESETDKCTQLSINWLSLWKEKTNRQTDKQTNRQTDKQTNRRTDKQTNRQTDKQTNRQTDKQTNRLADKQTTNKQTGKQTKPSLYYNWWPLYCYHSVNVIRLTLSQCDHIKRLLGRE
jgi:hypothetical protein